MSREHIIAAHPLDKFMEERGEELRRKGTELFCHCPLHEDKTPSFRINMEKGTWYCDPCGTGGSIIDLMAKLEGVPATSVYKRLSDELGCLPARFEPRNGSGQRTTTSKRTLVKLYDYTDERGKLLFQTERYEPKDFRQRSADGTPGIEGVRRVLYNLPLVSAADHIVICEGEKDADTVGVCGLTATTCPMGAGKWNDTYTPFFKGKRVLLTPDNDAPGQKHMKEVAEKVGEVARSVCILSVPGQHKDMSEWRRDFQSEIAFGTAILDAWEKLTPVAGGDALPIYDMDDMERRYKEALNSNAFQLDLSKLIPSFRQRVRPLVAGEVGTIVADTGVGKTFILQNIAVVTQTPILIFELELPDSLMFERFVGMGANFNTSQVEAIYREQKVVDWRKRNNLNHIYVCPKSSLTCEQIKSYIIRSELKIGSRPKVVMIDYVGLIRGEGKRYERMSTIAEDLKVMAKETETIILTTSQIHRKGEDQAEEIFLHDAKDSGSIENSSGLMLGAWRDSEDKDRLWIKMLKNTKGFAGWKVPLRINPLTLKLQEEYVERPKP